uniref:Putative secreted peptide n=1 Tax=Anopheles braziliensis TaxID=58242 RepID=A0A2M3ZPN0_9DIPT
MFAARLGFPIPGEALFPAVILNVLLRFASCCGDLSLFRFFILLSFEATFAQSFGINVCFFSAPIFYASVLYSPP